MHVIGLRIFSAIFCDVFHGLENMLWKVQVDLIVEARSEVPESLFRIQRGPYMGSASNLPLRTSNYSVDLRELDVRR